MKNKNKLKGCLMAAGLLISSVAAADFASDIGNLGAGVSSGSHDGGSWKGAGRQGYYGPGGYVSFKSKSIQLVSITPPSFSVGCSGISWSLGGFDFVDGEELVEFIQASGQAAASQIIMLSLKVLCPVCGQTLETIQSWAQMASNTALDSCDVGRKLANNAAGMALGGLRSECADKKSNDNTESSFYKSVREGVCGSDKSPSSIVSRLSDSLKEEGLVDEESSMAIQIKANPLWWAMKEGGVIPSSLQDNSSYTSVYSTLSSGSAGSLSKAYKVAFAEMLIGIVGTGRIPGITDPKAPLLFNIRPENKAVNAFVGMMMCGKDFNPGIGSGTDEDNSDIIDYCKNMSAFADTDVFVCQNASGQFMGETCTEDGEEEFKPGEGVLRQKNLKDMLDSTSVDLLAEKAFETGILDKVHESFKKAYENLSNNKSPDHDNRFLLFMLKVAPFDLYRVLNIASVSPSASKSITKASELFISYSILEAFIKEIAINVNHVGKKEGGKIVPLDVGPAISKVMGSLNKAMIVNPKKFQTGFLSRLKYQEYIMSAVRAIEQEVSKEVSVKYLNRGKRFRSEFVSNSRATQDSD